MASKPTRGSIRYLDSRGVYHYADPGAADYATVSMFATESYEPRAGWVPYEAPPGEDTLFMEEILDSKDAAVSLQLTTRALMGAAALWYTLPTRFYHTIDHANKVLANCRLLSSTISNSLQIAAMWHDAVYIPGAEVGLNEKMSAAAMRYQARGPAQKQLGFIVDSAAELITRTSIAYHLSTNALSGELAVLLDADIQSLAVPYEEFRKNQANIASEYMVEVTPAFLQKLVGSRKFLYHTRTGRELWESDAQANIARFTKEYSCQD